MGNCLGTQQRFENYPGGYGVVLPKFQPPQSQISRFSFFLEITQILSMPEILSLPEVFSIPEILSISEVLSNPEVFSIPQVSSIPVSK